MKKFLHILIKSIAALLAILIVAVLVLTFSGITVNLNAIRGGVEVAASSALDRDVTIEGPVELEFSNWPALNISDVKIANVEGAAEPNILHAGFMRIQIGVFPLIKGQINIADISAKDVTLNLESDDQGKPNWIFAQASTQKAHKSVSEKPAKTEIATPEEPQPPKKSKRFAFAALKHLSLQQIFVNYHDAALNKSVSFVLESMQGTAAEGQAIEFKLNGLVENKSYELTLNGGSIEDLLDKDISWVFEAQGEVSGKQVAGKGKLWLRGERPEIGLMLSARDLDVGAILSTLGLVEGMQASLGDIGMDITLTGDSLREVLSKSSMIFTVKDGNWKVAVPSTDASFDINKLDGEIVVRQGNKVSMSLAGMIEEVPVKLLIGGAPLVDYVTRQEELPLSINVEMLETKLSFDSSIKLPVSSTDMTFSLAINSQRIDAFNKLLKLDLPSIGPVSLESKLDILPQFFNLSGLYLKVGMSSLDGDFKLDLSQAKPKLDISLLSALLQMDDFRTGQTEKRDQTNTEEVEEQNTTASKSEAPVVEPTQNEPRSLLSYEVLNAFDASIAVTAEQVLGGKEKLGSAKVLFELQDSSLRVEPISLEIPGGRFEAGIDYTLSPTDMALKIKADIEDFDMGVLVRHLKPESDMGGRLYLDIEMDSTAPDPTTILANASGHLDFGLVPENFSSGVIDLWAVNLLSAIMDKSTEKDQSVINCVVVRTRLTEGLLEEEAIYLDTSNMRIAGKMNIDFKTRDLEIKLAPKAKSPEFFSVAIPIQVKGNLDDFGLKIGALRMAGQIISFITSPIHVPIRRVFTEDAPEEGVAACTHAWTMTKEKKPAPSEKLLY